MCGGVAQIFTFTFFWFHWKILDSKINWAFVALDNLEKEPLQAVPFLHEPNPFNTGSRLLNYIHRRKKGRQLGNIDERFLRLAEFLALPPGFFRKVLP